jgi:hypothetical protein
MRRLPAAKPARSADAAMTEAAPKAKAGHISPAVMPAAVTSRGHVATIADHAMTVRATTVVPVVANAARRVSAARKVNAVTMASAAVVVVAAVAVVKVVFNLVAAVVAAVRAGAARAASASGR